MATSAMHLKSIGDVSSEVPDICLVHKEDTDNFYGSWVFGVCFVDVQFPKATTRDLTPEEVEHYHGRNVFMGGLVSPLNLKGEDFRKHVRLYKDGTKIKEGVLTSPLKLGGQIVLDYGHFHSSKIKGMSHDKTAIETLNSIYSIEYLDHLDK